MSDNREKNMSDLIDDIHPMFGDMLKEWVELRLATYYRQIIVFRKISAKVQSGSLSRNKDERLLTDNDLSEIAHEWITLSNYLTAIALGFNVDNPKDDESEIIKSLSENEKTKIIMIQDKVNGLDMLSILAEIDNKSASDAINSARDARSEIDKSEKLRNSVFAQVEKIREDVREKVSEDLRVSKKKKDVIFISKKLAKKLIKQLGPSTEAGLGRVTNLPA